MDTPVKEQDLRREGVRRYQQGERPCDICRALHRTTRWLNKWCSRFANDPGTDWSNQSRAPHHSPQRIPVEVERVIVSVRRARERGKAPGTRYGLIGCRSVQTELMALQVERVPSEATIQRVMSRHGLTHRVGANAAAAYYPWPIALEPADIQATDLITRHLWGGARVENIHTIDLYSLSISMSQSPMKSSAVICQHLLKTWALLGLPGVHQTDNEAVFRGGHSHPRVIGQVVRLCLFCGIEPLFTPEYDPKRNYQVESFHSLWVKAFWSRHTFTRLAQISRGAQTFAQWYQDRYRPPSLGGLTPNQVRPTHHATGAVTPLLGLIPLTRLPITAGRIHFMRKVDAQGQISLLNESWPLSPQWVGEYVLATINTREQCLSFWHKPSMLGAWVHIKTRRFVLEEPVHDLRPEFMRDSERCRDQWPG